MFRPQKETVVSEIREMLDKSAGVLFLDFTGLTVEEANNFRRELQKNDLGYRVVKNTLMRQALEGTPYASAGDVLPGTPTGVLFGYDDPVTGAKLTKEFIKKGGHLRVKGAVVESTALSLDEAEALAEMPTKGEAQAAIVGLAMSPGRTLAGQLKSPAGQIVGAIEALVDKLEGAA